MCIPVIKPFIILRSSAHICILMTEVRCRKYVLFAWVIDTCLHASTMLCALCRRATLAEIELSSVGMNDIFDKEGLSVTDDELAAEVDSVTAEFGRNGQAFDKERLEEQAMEVLKVGDSYN